MPAESNIPDETSTGARRRLSPETVGPAAPSRPAVVLTNSGNGSRGTPTFSLLHSAGRNLARELVAVPTAAGRHGPCENA